MIPIMQLKIILKLLLVRNSSKTKANLD